MLNHYHHYQFLQMVYKLITKILWKLFSGLILFPVNQSDNNFAHVSSDLYKIVFHTSAPYILMKFLRTYSYKIQIKTGWETKNFWHSPELGTQ